MTVCRDSDAGADRQGNLVGLLQKHVPGKLIDS